MITTKEELLNLLKERSQDALTKKLPGIALGLTLARLHVLAEFNPPEQPEPPKNTPCVHCGGRGFRPVVLGVNPLQTVLETCLYCQGMGTINQGGKH